MGFFNSFYQFVRYRCEIYRSTVPSILLDLFLTDVTLLWYQAVFSRRLQAI